MKFFIAAQQTGSILDGKLSTTLENLAVLPNSSDDEIIAIFLEEFSVEAVKLAHQFPIWDNNPQDDHALAKIRRSFRILQGSGRFIGADFISEYALYHEKILDHVIEGDIEADEKVRFCIGEGIRLLPKLQRQLEQCEKPDNEIIQHAKWVKTLSLLENKAKKLMTSFGQTKN